MITTKNRQYGRLSAVRFPLFLAGLAFLLLLPAQAAPITVPDLTHCELAVGSSVVGAPLTLSFNCCLPVKSAVDFDSLGSTQGPTRVRRAAHLADSATAAKYAKAYELMRALPADDPRSLSAQANIHCAFCNAAYMQTGTNIPLQIHFSWLFLPWHRWYIYFHERILAKLVGDPDFALLFWNWDNQDPTEGGNVMPGIFTDSSSALYDAKRNQDNLPPTLVRLSALSTTNNTTEVVNENLNAMYQSLVTATTADLFMGGPYRAGTDLSNSTVINAPLGGSIENGVHGSIHFWTGNPTQPLLEDMGVFTTASRDPIFYAHHSNTDRLWDVWRNKLPGGRRTDHSDADFLNAEFLFYDENANLVKVKAGDALDSAKMGVSYEKVQADALWINYAPQPASTGNFAANATEMGLEEIGSAAPNSSSASSGDEIQLGKKLSAVVRRPSGVKPAGLDEVLVIQGVEVNRDSFAQLVVFVNLPDANDTTKVSGAEYVGSFNIIPSPGKHKHLFTNVKLEIGDNLKRIGIQNDDKVVITIVVKSHRQHVDISIRGMEIHYE